MKNIRHDLIFPTQLAFGVFFLKLFGDVRKARADFEALEHCPDGTIGQGIWQMLNGGQYEPVPFYEKHDLKHVLLGYPPAACDEMRMQAFMFGNAGFSLSSLVMFGMFVVWTPEVWLELPYHFRVGQLTKPVGDWEIADFKNKKVSELRLEIGLDRAHELARLEFLGAFERRVLPG